LQLLVATSSIQARTFANNSPNDHQIVNQFLERPAYSMNRMQDYDLAE
jgi:hypothetical protein